MIHSGHTDPLAPLGSGNGRTLPKYQLLDVNQGQFWSPLCRGSGVRPGGRTLLGVPCFPWPFQSHRPSIVPSVTSSASTTPRPPPPPLCFQPSEIFMFKESSLLTLLLLLLACNRRPRAPISFGASRLLLSVSGRRSNPLQATQHKALPSGFCFGLCSLAVLTPQGLAHARQTYYC